jgi:MFS superfamily sulfate permease-like transporter
LLSILFGYTTLQVITSQLKGLFGMTYPGRGFVKIWYGFFANITTVKLSDTGASLVTFAILFFIKVTGDIFIGMHRLI